MNRSRKPQKLFEFKGRCYAAPIVEDESGFSVSIMKSVSRQEFFFIDRACGEFRYIKKLQGSDWIAYTWHLPFSVIQWPGLEEGGMVDTLEKLAFVYLQGFQLIDPYAEFFSISMRLKPSYSWQPVYDDIC